MDLNDSAIDDLDLSKTTRLLFKRLLPITPRIGIFDNLFMSFTVCTFVSKNTSKKTNKNGIAKPKREAITLLSSVFGPTWPPPISFAGSITNTSLTLAAFTRPASLRFARNKS